MSLCIYESNRKKLIIVCFSYVKSYAKKLTLKSKLGNENNGSPTKFDFASDLRDQEVADFFVSCTCLNLRQIHLGNGAT